MVGRAIVPFTKGGRPVMIVERERILIAKHSEVASLTRQGRLLWHVRLSEK